MLCCESPSLPNVHHPLVIAAGDIVGEYQSSPVVINGFLLRGGTYTTLADPLATQHFTEASGINNAGQIVGIYSAGNGTHGFLLSGGTYTTIDDPLATNGNGAQAINDRGQIVGSYTNATGSHGFLLSGGVYTTLDDPVTGARNTRAFGVNNAGQIVGSYQD